MPPIPLPAGGHPHVPGPIARPAAVPGLAITGPRPRPVVATALFADLRRFTWLSNTLGPAATFALLDDYCRLIRPCLDREHCSLDRFIGDGVMAIFGLSPPPGADADQAVRAAATIQLALAAWNRARLRLGQPILEVGIGIDTDLLVAGCLYASGPGDLTCIGDGVNVSARLEKACKRYATGILITENTRRRLTDVRDIRPIDTIVVEGRPEPIDIFEVLDHRPAGSRSIRQQQIDLSTEALTLFRGRQFNAAAHCFQRVLTVDPDDTFARRFAERCRELDRRPPDENWQPITVLPGT